MQRIFHWFRTALVGLGAVAAGAFGALALLNQLAAGRAMPMALAAEAPHGDERTSTPATPAVPPGWQAVEQHGLPAPTYWPAALALAITFLAWGIATTWLISAVGLVLFIVALAGWIGDMLHGH
jgi:hypothetical protein